MNIDLTDEQKMLHDAVHRYLAGLSDKKQKTRDDSTEKNVLEIWDSFAKYGWLGMCNKRGISDETGSFAEALLISEAIGRHLIDIPFLSTVVIAETLISLCKETNHNTDILQSIISGKTIVSLAHFERNANYISSPTCSKAVALDEGFRLDASKINVLSAALADYLIVSANIHEKDSEKSEFGLFIIPKDLDGISIDTISSIDGSPVSTVSIRNVIVNPANLLIKGKNAITTLNHTLIFAICATCAEIVGSMQTLFNQTVSYLKIRRQFNSPLIEFQALQHRVTDMYMDLFQCKIYIEFMCNIASSDREIDYSFTLSAKKFIDQASIRIANEAIQLHGGIGVTQELSVGNHYKRIISRQNIFTTPA